MENQTSGPRTTRVVFRDVTGAELVVPTDGVTFDPPVFRSGGQIGKSYAGAIETFTAPIRDYRTSPHLDRMLRSIATAWDTRMSLLPRRGRAPRRRFGV
jgi:hypothetical protein